MPRHFRQGICSSHLTLCLNLNVIFEYFSRAWSDLKSLCTFFAAACHSRVHDVIGEKFLLTKPIKFGIIGRRILYWLVFAIKPVADFCLFLGYWSSKSLSRDHGIKAELYLTQSLLYFVPLERFFYVNQCL